MNSIFVELLPLYERITLRRRGIRRVNLEETYFLKTIEYEIGTQESGQAKVEFSKLQEFRTNGKSTRVWSRKVFSGQLEQRFGKRRNFRKFNKTSYGNIRWRRKRYGKWVKSYRTFDV